MPISSSTLATRLQEKLSNGYLNSDELREVVDLAKSDGTISEADKAAARSVLAGRENQMGMASAALARSVFGADVFEAASPTPWNPSNPVTPPVTPPTPERRDLEDPAVLNKHSSTLSYDWLPGTLFVDGAKAEDVLQGSIANCYMVAAFASVARNTPELIENAISDNGDGTYTVRLHDVSSYGGTSGQVEIVVDGELAVSGSSLQYAKGSDRSELWVPLLEKAFAQWKGNFEAIGNGGSAGMVMSALTGRRSESISLGSTYLTDDQVFDKIKSTLDRNGAVAAGTHGKDRTDLYTNSGMYAWHAYTVMGVSEENGTKYVELRNPWGRSEPTGNGPDDGVFKLSVADFRKYYSSAYLN